MKKTLLVVASTAFTLSATPALAQGPDAQDAIAAVALMATPIGALPPLATGRIDAGAGTSWNFAYGRMSLGEGESRNGFAAGVDLGFGRARLGVQVGYNTYSIENSKSDLMAGLRLGTPLVSSNFGKSTMSLGLETQVGWGQLKGEPVDFTAYSLTAGVPLSLAINSGSVKFIPFVTPAFGVGALRADGQSENGTRFLMGGGMGVGFANGMGLNLGAQRIFIDGGETQWGLGFTYRPGARR